LQAEFMEEVERWVGQHEFDPFSENIWSRVDFREPSPPAARWQ